MRITNRMVSENIANDMQRALSSLMSVQEQLSSGKRVNKPSDDPFATHRAINSRGAVMILEQFARNLKEIKGWVSTTEYALSGVTEALRETRTLAIQAANGYLAPSDKESIALRIDEMREAIMQLSRQQYSGRFIFSGTKTDEPPFTWTGTNVVYNGNDADMTVNIGPGSDMVVNINGREAFMEIGPSGVDVFGLLYDLAHAVREGRCADISGDLLGAVDDALERVVEKQGIAGSSYKRIENMEALLDQLVERERELLSEDEDIDIAEAIMNLNLKQNAYQASLAACARVIIPSLLDYMK